MCVCVCVCVYHIYAYTNIPSTIFYSSTMSEFPKIARSTYYLKTCSKKSIRSNDQSRRFQTVPKQIKKAFNRHPGGFSKISY